MFGKKMVEGKARILACEGVTSGNSGTDLHGKLWMHYKYIVEVHPAGGSAFRAEVKVKAAHSPNVGDLVNARYDVSSHKVELILEGDPRYDPKLRRAEKKAKRDELLHGGAPAAVGTGLDPELQALMDMEEAERRAATSAPPSPSPLGSASRMDRLQQLGELRAQGILSAVEFEQEKARILSEQ
jgi:Short C-terminal domain